MSFKRIRPYVLGWKGPFNYVDKSTGEVGLRVSVSVALPSSSYTEGVTCDNYFLRVTSNNDYSWLKLGIVVDLEYEHFKSGDKVVALYPIDEED